MADDVLQSSVEIGCGSLPAREGYTVEQGLRILVVVGIIRFHGARPVLRVMDLLGLSWGGWVSPARKNGGQILNRVLSVSGDQVRGGVRLRRSICVQAVETDGEQLHDFPPLPFLSLPSLLLLPLIL